MYCAHCGSQLEARFKACPGCGKPVAAPATSAATSAAAQAVSAPARFSLRMRIAAACAVVALALVAVTLTNRLGTSYGPPEAANLDVIVAPGVVVEILPSAKSLAKARFDGFDVSPSGAIVALVDSQLVELASGEALFSTSSPVQSFAFIGDALAAIDADGNLAALEDGALRVIGKPPVEHARLAPSSEHTRLFFYRNEDGWLPDRPALAAMEKSSIRVLTGSTTAIGIAGGDAFQTLFATGNALFHVITPGRPSLVLTLPDPAQAIIGIGIAGTATYFSTAHAVYALQDDIVIPIVLGLGGELRVSEGAVYVLDARQRRIYRITVANGRPS